jgi:hypothetical protein
MRIVLVMAVAALAGCASRPRETPVQQAQRICLQMGHTAGTPEQRACTERTFGKMVDYEASRPAWQPPQQPQTVYVQPRGPYYVRPAQ